MESAPRIRQLDNDIWIVHGSDVVFAGAAMHTRMTVVRLRNGGLWVHSPIEIDAEVEAFISALATPVTALVAPNKFHHLYMPAWRQAYPRSKVFAEATLMQKVRQLADAEVINDAAPALYRDEFDQLLIQGNRMFKEAVFFHKPSRTLILTDLMINLPADNIKGLARLFLRFEGVIYPHGGIPRLYRWFTSNRQAARQAAQQMIDWAPQRIVFSHGEIFEQDAEAILQQEFAYLFN